MLAYVALGIAGLALWRCPFWGTGKRVFLPLYLWALYCALAPVNLLGIQLLAYRWPLAIASGCVGLYWWATARVRPVDAVTYGSLLLIGMALTSTAWSRLPDYTFGRALALLPIFGFTILGVRSLLLRPGGLEAVGLSLLVVLVIPAALAFSSSFEDDVYIDTDADSYRFQGYMKATGTGHVIVNVFPFLFWYMRHGAASRKLFNFGAFGYLTFLLLATRTRTSLASALLVVPVAWSTIMSGRKLGGSTMTTLGLLMAVAIGIQFLPEDLVKGYSRTSSANDLVKTRMEGRWDIIWDKSMESPLIGHGLGTVRFYASPLASFDFSSADESRRAFQKHTHNEYLSLFYDLGFLPPLLFLAFCLATVRAGVRWILSPTSRRRDFMVAVFLCVAVDIINTVSHDGLMTVGNPGATFFWIKCLMLLTLQPEPRR